MEDYKLLSIIVPAYNVEQYLARCVDSCESIDVPREDFELIIINDGSSDATLQVANDCAQRYRNIEVLSQPNQGQSVARNAGIKCAKGEYLWFIDSDDYVLPNGVGEVLNQCRKHNIDISFFRMCIETSDGKSYLSEMICEETNTIICGKNVVLSGYSGGSVCNSFYSRNFLNGNDLWFFSGIIHQDCELSIRAVAQAERVMQFDVPLYVYFYNSQSCTRSKDYNKLRKAYISDAVISEKFRTFAAGLADKQLQRHIIKVSNSIVVGSLLMQLRSQNKYKHALLREYWKEIEARDLYPIKGHTLSWKTTMLIPLINCRWLMRLLQKLR